jgi:BlaI family transcriptional regulator, penicillinase repressor
MADRPGLSEAEMEVLKALWAHGPGTVRRINEVLVGRRWAYTTVLTLLQRLLAKGYAASEASGVAHVFRAAVTREEVLESRLKDTADELCDGSAAPLLLALVQGNKFTPEELARFRRLLDEAGGKPRRPS